MFQIDCCTAQDYHELNAGAHRKAPKVLSAPSLVWHLAFWVDFEKVGDNDKPPATGRRTGNRKHWTRRSSQSTATLSRCSEAAMPALD